MNILIEFLKWLPRYFFPKICYGCGKEGPVLSKSERWTVCPTCRPTVDRIIDHPICPACHNPSPGGFVHSGCRTSSTLDGLTSYYRYQGWAKEIIKKAKFGKDHHFGGLKALSNEFGIELASRGRSFPGKDRPLFNCVIVPIPLHWWRERKRGFNQATLIAKELSKKLGIPLDLALLKRIRYTEPQTIITSSVRVSKEALKEFEKKYPSALNREHAIKKLTHRIATRERLENIRGAFAIKRTKDIPRSILLVDDVWTTGATMKECCRVLLRSDVKKVWGITLLRA